jgi:hypothetical protein
MVNYIIGFKSGERITIQVKDGVKFVDGIVSGVKQSPSSQVQWFVEPGMLLNVSEICFALPDSAIKQG